MREREKWREMNRFNTWSIWSIANDASSAADEKEAKIIATKPFEVDLEEENSSEEWSVKDKDVIPKEASIPESSAQVDIDGDNNPFAAAEEEDAGSVPKRQEDGDGDTT